MGYICCGRLWTAGSAREFDREPIRRNGWTLSEAFFGITSSIIILRGREIRKLSWQVSPLPTLYNEPWDAIKG